MEYHSYASLNKTINDQYLKDKEKNNSNNKQYSQNQIQTFNKLLKAYNKPNPNNLIDFMSKAVNVNVPDKPNPYAYYDNIDNYVYLSKNYEF